MLDAVMNPIQMTKQSSMYFKRRTRMLTGVMKPLPGFLSESRSKDIYGWKKVYHLDNLVEGWPMYGIVIAKLIIPKDAAVVFTNHKCRASYAIVDGFYSHDLIFQPGTKKKTGYETGIFSMEYAFLLRRWKDSYPRQL